MAVSALQQGYRVGIASLELPAEDVVEVMAEIAATNRRPPEKWLKDFMKWADDRLFIYDKVDAITPIEALQMCICMRAFLGCDLIIVDCLMMCGVTDDLQAEKEVRPAAVSDRQSLISARSSSFTTCGSHQRDRAARRSCRIATTS